MIKYDFSSLYLYMHMLVNPITCLGHTDGLFTYTKGKGGITIPSPQHNSSTYHKWFMGKTTKEKTKNKNIYFLVNIWTIGAGT